MEVHILISSFIFYHFISDIQFIMMMTYGTGSRHGETLAIFLLVYTNT